MTRNQPPLEELRALWKKRLQAAEQELQAARLEVQQLQAEMKSESIPSPDIHYAYQRALRAENLAVEKCLTVLITFNDLVLHGKIPDEAARSNERR